MKIEGRFTDYVLIGGFFWTLQLILLVAVVGFEENFLHRWWLGFQSVLGAVPKETLPSLSALLGALALIAVFATGLLLDLFSGFYLRLSQVCMGCFI